MTGQLVIDLGFCDAVGLVAPGDPTPPVSNDRLSLSPRVFLSLMGWKRGAPEGAGFLGFSSP